MKTLKKIGIWMDHSIAHLIEFSSEIKPTISIQCDFTKIDKEETLQRGEKEMHHKEQQKHASFYKDIAAEIINYNEVLLFGPTDAKMELFNSLKKNHLFETIKIVCKTTDKMTDKEAHLFVKEYFKRHEFTM